MSDNSNKKKFEKNFDRFSEEQEISHYTSIVYVPTEEEIIRNGGHRHIIGSHCRCRDKSTCACMEKLKQHFNRR
jgi:hypothetical protein